MKMESLDLLNENIEQIAALFPNVITETRAADGSLCKAIDFDKLKIELGGELADSRESYEFTWVGKKQAMLEANAPIRKTLRPSVEESKNWENTENLYIEGDNLEALKLLQESYLGKIKMIYIDPPYNTGNDFIYDDDFTVSSSKYETQVGMFDESGFKQYKINNPTNGRFHSDWCTMIYPRLKIAKNLLSEKGTIFISIDDNEVNNLKQICDEVFGQENFIAQITILCNPKGRSQDKYFATNHEYLLCYSKNRLDKGTFSILKEEDQIDQEYTEVDEVGKYRLLELRNTHREFGRHNRPNLYYPIFVNARGVVSLSSELNSLPIYPNWDDGFEGCWTWGKEKLQKEVNLVVAKPVRNNWKIYRKNYGMNSEKMLKTIFVEKEFYTEKGQKAFNELFVSKEKIFQSPKSPFLIQQLINLFVSDNDEDSIILDFFSGSATTAQSVFQVNVQAGCNFQFLLIQLPEETKESSEAKKMGYSTICDIGKERIRRAGEKIKEEVEKANRQPKLGEEPINIPDIGFRVFKVDSGNMKDVYYSPSETSQAMLTNLESNIKEDRSDLDLLYGVILDWGLPLSLPHTQLNLSGAKVHNVDDGSLMACFEKKVSEEAVRAIAKQKPLRVVFRDEGFASSAEKINVTEIFKVLSPNTTVKVI